VAQHERLEWPVAAQQADEVPEPGEEVLAHVETCLGIKAGQSTPDGKFYLKVEEECLAACCGAPMMMVDHVYHENLTSKSAAEILAAVKD